MYQGIFPDIYGFSTAVRGIVIRTSLEISKTPVVGSDLISGVAG
jgi:hypothetical protein